MRTLWVTVLCIIMASSALAGVRLKPGPQLWVFATKGDLASVKKLVESNAFDGDVLGRAMYNSLRRADLAKSADNLTVVKLFLSYGANPNYIALNGQTPLIAAAIAANTDAARMLLENGADPKIADQSGKTPADYANTTQGAQAIAALIAYPPESKPIEKAKVEPKVLNLDLSMEGASVYMAYDLVAEGPVCVKVIGSLDKGATYSMKFAGATGDIGKNITPGERKKIVWNSAYDYPKGFSEMDALIDVVAEPCK